MTPEGTIADFDRRVLSFLASPIIPIVVMLVVPKPALWLPRQLG